jgi:cyclopropane-fatty-acyl-phospholipid synthase
MSLRYRFLAKLRDRVADHRLNLRLIFWDGEIFDFAADPTVAIVLRSPHVSHFLLTGDIARLGRAYVEGEIDVEGRLQYILQAVWRLPSGSANRRPSAS